MGTMGNVARIFLKFLNLPLIYARAHFNLSTVGFQCIG